MVELRGWGAIPLSGDWFFKRIAVHSVRQDSDAWDGRETLGQHVCTVSHADWLAGRTVFFNFAAIGGGGQNLFAVHDVVFMSERLCLPFTGLGMRGCIIALKRLCSLGYGELLATCI